jgi:ankyrin repeat protein
MWLPASAIQHTGPQLPPTPLGRLYKATLDNDVKGIRKALAEGANVNDQGGAYRYTPLEYATLESLTDAMRELLKHGANPNLRDYKGMTALELVPASAWSGGEHSDEIGLLLSHGADMYASNFKAIRTLRGDHRALGRELMWALQSEWILQMTPDYPKAYYCIRMGADCTVRTARSVMKNSATRLNSQITGTEPSLPDTFVSLL